MQSLKKARFEDPRRTSEKQQGRGGEGWGGQERIWEERGGWGGVGKGRGKRLSKYLTV